MNKKLIAVAVAAAFAAPMAASADATIYGSIHTSVEGNKTKNGAGQKINDNWDVIGNDGQLGIKGSEDLGNGLKALYKIEVNLDTSGGDLASQSQAPVATWDEVWVGLSGGWGTALIGREDTPYKTFMDSAGVDILGDSIVDVDNMLVGVGAGGFERFTANGAIAYVSPNFSGFTFGAAIIPGAQEPAVPGGGINVDGLNVKDGFADHYSLGANFVAGGLKVAGAYEKKVPVIGVNPGAVLPASDFSDQKVWGVGASYDFGAFFVGAKYEDEKNFGWGNNVDAKRFALSGKYSFGNNAIGVVYGEDETKANSVVENDAKGWGVFAEHNLSNRTKVYVAYNDAEDKKADTTVDDTDGAEERAFAVGVIHSF
jgi:predicted porin